MKGVLWSLTYARIALVPVFLAGALRMQALVESGTDPGRLRWGLLITLAAIAASDVVDGWMARRYGLATQAGALTDALADKATQIALVAFFTFGTGPAFASLPVWFFLLLVGRDAILGAGWATLRARRIPVRVVHRLHGRLATVAVFVLLFWLTAGLESDRFSAALLLAAALVWVSGAAYVADTWTAMARARDARPEAPAGRPW